MSNLNYETLKAEWQKEWNEKGEKYAKAVNDMVAFAEVHGWDAYEARICSMSACISQRWFSHY